MTALPSPNSIDETETVRELNDLPAYVIPPGPTGDYDSEAYFVDLEHAVLYRQQLIDAGWTPTLDGMEAIEHPAHPGGLRGFRMAPGSGGDLRLNEYAWVVTAGEEVPEA